jgi:hypothetical protein
MTREEFKNWLTLHEAAFPEVSVWLDRQETRASQFILDLWAEALELVTYDDAVHCTKLMIGGKVDHPGRFDISRLPGTIVRNTPYRCPRLPESLPQ